MDREREREMERDMAMEMEMERDREMERTGRGTGTDPCAELEAARCRMLLTNSESKDQVPTFFFLSFAPHRSHQWR